MISSTIETTEQHRWPRDMEVLTPDVVDEVGRVRPATERQVVMLVLGGDDGVPAGHSALPVTARPQPSLPMGAPAVVPLLTMRAHERCHAIPVLARGRYRTFTSDRPAPAGHDLGYA